MEGSEEGFFFRSSCVKVYLCSNPEDSVQERRALRECVFPRLREYCRHTHGLDFRVMDPYEATDQRRWPGQQSREHVLQACRESSPGPFLVALLGDKYGPACLPAQMEVAEFQQILQTGQRAGVSTRGLEGAYVRDENATPPCFRLQGRSHTPQPPGAQSNGTTGDTDSLCEEMGGQEKLTEALKAAVSQCVLEGLMTTERAQTYCRSVLDMDLRFALENRPPENIINRCLVYVHKTSNRSSQRENKLLSQLCDHFLPDLVTSCQLQVYTATSECDRRQRSTLPKKLSYIEELCEQIHSDLRRLIARSVTLETGQRSPQCVPGDVLAREQAEWRELCSILSRLYDVKRPEEEEVRKYLDQRDIRRPLLVVGGPCTGKTVLLSHCAWQVRSWLSDRDPEVIIFFTDLSIHSSPKHLLLSLMCQISQSYNHPDPDQRPITNPLYPDPNLSLPQLRHKLLGLLSTLPSSKRPLILILDGLNLGGHTSDAQIIQHLPSPLPPNVKLVLSVSPAQTETLRALKLHYPQSSTADGCVRVELESVERTGCVRMLASLLSASGRKVTSGQQAVVNRALASCPLTLYARLLHMHTSLWSSATEVTESSLPVGVHSSISALLMHLEEKHGSTLVSVALSYLTLSRAGLTEGELTDLLSSHDDVLAGYVQQNEGPPSRFRVPEVDVERLLLDLKGFLEKRTVAGARVLFWVSRHFGLVVCKRYLQVVEARVEFHSEMADYFSDRWAYGRAKPLVINPTTGPNQTGAVSNPAAKIYIDRQPNSQPYVFNTVQLPSCSSSVSSSEHSHINFRKLLELPHHLQKSNRGKELRNGLLISLGFHQAMLRAGLLGELICLLEVGALSRERVLLAGMLRASACLLWSSPLEPPTVMEMKLHPFLGVCPGLESYVREVEQERRRTGSGIGAVLSPAPSTVPSMRYVLETGEGKRTVTAVAGTECGTVVISLGDGSVWVWKGSNVQELMLTHEPNMCFVSVKNSGRFILMTTKCNRVLLWDVKDLETIQELKDTRGLQSGPDQNTHPTVAGFVVCEDRVCVWWKGFNFLSVWGLQGEPLTYLQCQNTVTCVLSSPGGCLLYCGQEKGMVSMFDMKSCSLLASCSGPTENAFISVILSQDEEEMACIDHIGNIFLWEMTNKGEEPSFIRECYSRNCSTAIRNIDHSKEAHILLVCEAQQILLWDTHDWEQWDQFLAPQGRAFTQVMVSQDSHLLLATVEACPSVLVWRITTGQCVLSLDTCTLSKPLTLLKMGSTLCAVTGNGSLTTWDSELVYAAGMAPRMQAGVRQVVTEPMGERSTFYVSDGSERVWRWDLQTGSPEAIFLHDLPVEKLCLSPDGSHLVTLSGREVNVWECRTGKNLHRIHCGKARDILITPNWNIGVCFSEHGLTRVWKLATGAIVCNIHLYLKDAQISTESTFLIGLHRGDLLAASLWSGSISKRFSSSECPEHVLAFQTLPEHPDFVMVMTASGALYTWRVAEETVCRQFQLPPPFLCQPQVFQMSSDGSYALLSIDDDVITLLDFFSSRLCSVRAEGPVLKVCLDDTGHYVVYISQPLAQNKGCTCDLHSEPVLTVVRLRDGSKVGRLCLCKMPLTLMICKEFFVYVGFQDGSVGVYATFDAMRTRRGAVWGKLNLTGLPRPCQCDNEPLTWLPLATPSTTWLEQSQMV
ncbi:NACHT and WD repeat domain-containing protein 2 isoform X1 [Hypomesus transpacificus]|uniref:NACHT and WD repeat domain-containing protein 2 isoform X1 n=2 Tax=Hypomesus transpacificus TaxID=137520 RepID=UPI001F07B4E8|nr:NACHT and WD repeat domain-containing protein 2 isoform X1 [Hypomesus transpacificus]